MSEVPAVPTGFRVPGKCISGPPDMETWYKSMGYRMIHQFIAAVNTACRSKDMEELGAPSEHITAILSVLDVLEATIEEVPPIKKRMRFGNLAFRDLCTVCDGKAIPLHEEMLPEHDHPAIVELCFYLVNSLGDRNRIDYGTGHELNFLVWLIGLYRIGFLVKSDLAHIGLTVYWRYLHLVQKVQEVYTLEPAGSHGVWLVDDFQLLPFVWGSSQLVENGMYELSDIHKPLSVSGGSKAYLYFDMVRHIIKEKGSRLDEVTPFLADIHRSSPSWRHMNAGFLRMYEDDVLRKWVVVQHLYFGALLPY
ncbi:phosphotyrosyl phosphatase activator, PTPA [Kipferlia bialata]|uniref:Serine/threonine-protein phosphatase 2A activator n=1 Tax=Kipferlia bialata TaxID=797122 RepID=A0A9K3GIC4_9EUKA|nr:phosphotyrosyl phosphatase activator, PTPA [Kipferlia bialata]|eukprot:g6677.t1